MATAATRIYIVEAEGQDKRLVRAISPAQAIGHVVRSDYSAHVASQDELIALAGNVQVESAVKADD